MPRSKSVQDAVRKELNDAINRLTTRRADVQAAIDDGHGELSSPYLLGFRSFLIDPMIRVCGHARLKGLGLFMAPAPSSKVKALQQQT